MASSLYISGIADKVHVEVEQDYTTLCLCLTPVSAQVDCMSVHGLFVSAWCVYMS